MQLDSIKTCVESAPGVCNQRLKVKCDEPLSNFAFNFNLRRYTTGYVRVDLATGETQRWWAGNRCFCEELVVGLLGFSALATSSVAF